MGVVADVGAAAARMGARVIRNPNAENIGNGSSWGEIVGIINHHTAGGNNIYVDSNLTTGVPGLSGPLCNFALLYDGDICIVAEGPANHAGASGGWDTAPMPVTNDFNRRVLGVEIQYKGTEPMSDAQWRSLAILNAAVTIVLNRGPEWIKTHNGTSIQGKWDPGYAMGKTYNIVDIRNAAWAARTPVAQPTPGVIGAIAEHYNNTPGLKDVLGAPVTPELTTPDGIGRYNHFERSDGSIYWTPRTGAQAVYGEIRKAWAASGWELGPLGYPVSDEFNGPFGRQSNFEHGWIDYTGRANIHT